MRLDGGLLAAAFAAAATTSFFLTPLVRRGCVRFGLLDQPGSAVKTHTVATPVFGGVAIFGGFMAAMLFLQTGRADPRPPGWSERTPPAWPTQKI